jgi:4-amino-4-deoxy-L-arabinose transferase-like glycosyltransferase
MSRPEYLIFPAILALYVIMVNRVILKKALASVVLLSIGFALVVFPWTMRNWIVFKKPIAVSVGGVGYGLFLGTFETNTNWEGWGVLPDAAFKDPAEKRQANEIYERYNRLMQEGTIDVKEPDDAFIKIALDRIRQNPVQCFKSWIVRIPRLWYIKYINMYGKPEASGRIFIIYFAFAFFAILRSEKSQRTLMAPMLLLFIYLTVIFLPFHIESRYSINLLPSILCLTGIGIYKLLPRLLER